MLLALYYCHEVVKVVHRDIKPENIVLSHNKEAILIDFGVSSQLGNSGGAATVGTYFYNSPEMLCKEQFSREFKIKNPEEGAKMNDLWALGMSFYRLLTGQFPFEETSNVMKL
mmetsp:Transcript_3756/g.5682  ORF Transcript_3756/g.5682 Transcript_3756/m.5682 type:complete len:113 (+) Transcript_3756:1190-1528(+)